MKKETLLEKAKSSKIKIRNGRLSINNEQLQLAIAWLKGIVSTRQVSFAIGEKQIGGRALYRLAVWLRETYLRGKLKLK